MCECLSLLNKSDIKTSIKNQSLVNKTLEEIKNNYSQAETLAHV